MVRHCEKVYTFMTNSLKVNDLFFVRYGEDNPLVVRGAGAGLEVTAKGCLSDMVRAGFVMAGNAAKL